MRNHLRGWRACRGTVGLGSAWILRVTALAMLTVPIVLVIVSSFGADTYTSIPPSSFSLKWYENLLTQDEFVSAFLTSLTIATIVTPISVSIGTLAAYGLWKYPPVGAALLETLFMSPLLLPLVVTGLALLVFISRVGMDSGMAGIAMAHIIITFPYSFRAVMAALRRYDRQMDEAAASLRVNPTDTFRHVTLPLVRPGLFAGALFAFVMSFDDFAMTIFLITPGMRTLPIAIYQYTEFNPDPTVAAVSTVLIVAAAISVAMIERTIGLERFIGLKA